MRRNLSSTITHARQKALCERPHGSRAQLILVVAAATLLPVWASAQQGESWAQGIEALLARGRLQEARAQLSQQEAQRRESYTGLLLDARLLAAEQHFGESLKVLERCLVVRRDDPEVFKLVAENAIRLDKLDTAEMALRNAETLVPDDYLVRFHLGALRYTESRFLDARPELERAVSLRPEYMPAQLFLGLVLEELGGELEAAQAYRKAIALNEAQGGKSELPYLYLGRLFYRLTRIPEAAPLLRKASETNPRSAEAWLWLGKACSSLGHADEAVSALRSAIAADERLPEPHYVLSRVYLAQHHPELSAQELERFRQLQTPENRKHD